jgi:prephenate dehydratase
MIRAAYQGERGAFSESAARQMLGDALEMVPCNTFDDMFASVASRSADCCVAPIENSLAGSIHRNYDLMVEAALTIRGETSLRIVHNLIGTVDASIDGVRRVYSHPVALAQCARYLRARSFEVVPVHDTAGAVRMVMDLGDPAVAAIASADAASIYGATILERGVEDNAQNFTRFLLLARDGEAGPALRNPSGKWKTTLVVHLRNEPGSLVRALSIFAARGVDLSKIESRPIEGRPWEYAFHLDLVGAAESEPVAQSLLELAKATEMVRVLGSYESNVE